VICDASTVESTGGAYNCRLAKAEPERLLEVLTQPSSVSIVYSRILELEGGIGTYMLSLKTARPAIRVVVAIPC